MKNNPKNQWEDHLTRRARTENYPARSVYKLEEIQNKFKVMNKNDQVLDLGCAPGSWLLYASKQVGSGGRVLGIDLSSVDIKLPENVKAVKENVLNLEKLPVVDETTRFNVVLSDMAPSTTGRKDVDAIKSYELCCMALAVADQYLVPSGHFVCKIFQGNEFKEFEKKVKSKFKECKIFKPDSCRKQSKEIYMIAKFKN
ncbi:MAG: 50S rRNA methyltransferase [Desulfobacterales bacterium RIFOXYA12_FULL_46_15]|nr:MAG: 50S rRNA methyltransferase [Desulfobacterales bacterium RIFOXYA12_FULL_46_15]